MEKNAPIKQKIVSVDAGSPAARAGIRAGESLLTVNGERVNDLIDYEYLTAGETLRLGLEAADGSVRTVSVRKEDYEPLGLSFETALMSEMRTCRNKCAFCFVDQMPKGMRPSLSVKDDDWRLSFIMGNYVTLTNVSDEEFDRMIARRVSPLYISVHATEPEVRARLMKNRFAGNLIGRLARLKEAGLTFHAQVVLCPNLNDGEHLTRTLNDLKDLWPSCGSVAVVPVGLTAYREGLDPIDGWTKESAAKVIDGMIPFQQRCLSETGTPFAFLSDEWYLLAGRALPPYEYYGDFSQIENGVGLLRLFEDDFLYALADRSPRKTKKRFLIAGGTGCAGWFDSLYAKLVPYGAEIETAAIPAAFFGGNVSVAGLVTGGDILRALEGRKLPDTVLIPKNMLRENEPVFLDDVTVDELSARLGVKVLPFGSGDELIDIVFGEE